MIGGLLQGVEVSHKSAIFMDCSTFMVSKVMTRGFTKASASGQASIPKIFMVPLTS